MSVQAPTDPSTRAVKALLLLLSLTTGTADIIGYLGLNGLFTAQITGNLAVMASQFVQHGSGHVAQLLSVPVFIAAVVLAFLLARALVRFGREPLRTMLALQVLLLLGFLIFAVEGATAHGLDSTGTLVAGMLGVSAMAVQNALVQFSFKGVPSTTVMTSNSARFGLALGRRLLAGDAAEADAARTDLVRTGTMILGFLVGCALGTVCESAFGLRALVLPVGLASIALAIGHVITRRKRADDESTRRPGDAAQSASPVKSS